MDDIYNMGDNTIDPKLDTLESEIDRTVDVMNRQNSVASDLLELSGAMKEALTLLKKDFENLGEVANSGSIIKKLNDELGELDKNTERINNSMQQNIQSIEQKPEKPRVVSQKEFDGMDSDEVSKLISERRKYEDYNTNISRNLDSTSDGLYDSKFKLGQSELIMESLQKQFDQLKAKKQEESSTSSTETQETQNNDDENKKKKADDKKKVREKNPGWIGAFFKTFKTVGGGVLKTAMFPITMGLKTVTGILSGIWNSSLMSIAKVGAFIGLMVWSFDWIKVLLHNWKKEMTENYDKFMDKNSVWGSAMEKLVMFSETIQKFLDPSYHTDFLTEQEVSWMNIATSFGEALLEIMQAGLYTLFVELTRLINNALPFTDKHSRGSWYAKQNEQWNNVSDDNINSGNRNNVIKARESASLTRSSYVANQHMKFMGNDLSNNRNYDSLTDYHKEQFLSLISDQERGISGRTREETIDYYKNNPELLEDKFNKLISSIDKMIDDTGIENDEMSKILNSLSKSESGARLEHGDDKVNKILQAFVSSGYIDIDQITKHVNKTAQANFGNLSNATNHELRSLGFSDEEIATKHGMTKNTSLQPMGNNALTYIDKAGQVTNANLSSNINSLQLSMEKMMNEFIKADKEVGSTVAVNQNVNNNSYGGMTPTGDLPAYGNNIRFDKRR